MTEDAAFWVGMCDAREKFKKAAEAAIREKLPPTGDFSRLVPREISNFGDDVIIGVSRAHNTEKVISNHFFGDSIITLAKSTHIDVEYKREILVNKSLGEVVY